MAPLKHMRKRLSRWTWGAATRCCCVVEKLDSWESMREEDWKDKYLSPWASTEHGDEYGHLVSVDLMESWGSRGNFMRALKEENFLAPGSTLNLHPVLPVCLGFRNCELTSGKDYSCYCRVRAILRGAKSSDNDLEKVKLDCEPVMNGISAAYWVQCINPMLSHLYQLSNLRHKRSNFSIKKLMTNDAIMSDPIHMMYVHIEGMLPQFGPFLFEAWRRNQGLQMGSAGEALNHGLGVIITHPRRQALEAQLRQIFPNKPLRLKPSCVRLCNVRHRSSVIGISSSCIFASTVVGELGQALKKPEMVRPVVDSGSAANLNQSANESISPEKGHGGESVETGSGLSAVVDSILPAVIPENQRKQLASLKKRTALRQIKVWCRNSFREIYKRKRTH